MRRVLPFVCMLSFAFVAACDSSTETDDNFFVASLRGDEEVDPVETDATGEAEFLHDVSEAELDYILAVDDIEDATAAHIHLGAPGENGPVIAFLFDPANPVSVTTPTVIATGSIDESDVIAVTGFDGTFASLIAEIEAGNTYVNVHTTENPAGEVRGQIERP